jgi:hypothetical protein
LAHQTMHDTLHHELPSDIRLLGPNVGVHASRGSAKAPP